MSSTIFGQSTQQSRNEFLAGEAGWKKKTDCSVSFIPTVAWTLTQLDYGSPDRTPSNFIQIQLNLSSISKTHLNQIWRI